MAAQNPFKSQKESTPESTEVSFDISLNEDDAEILRKTDAWIKDSDGFMSDKIKHWEDNNKWFEGKQWDNQKQEYQSDTTINRIFPAVRNMVGLATDSRPKADILPAPAMDPQTASVNKDKAKRLSLLFDQRWDELQMSVVGTKTLFQAFIYDDAYWMPYWNYQENDFDVEIILPKNLGWDPTATSIDDAYYVIAKANKNRKWIETNYPDLKDKVKYGIVKDINGKEINQGSKDLVTVYFIMTDEIRVVRTVDTVLEKSPNPYFEFRNEEAQLKDWVEAGNDQALFVPIKNYFRRPQKPIIQIPTYNVGELFSRSVIQQLKPVQRTIDKRKQQIDENANQTANAQWVYDSEVLEESKAELITNEPGLLIGVPGGPNTIRKEPGSDLPHYVLDDLLHSESTFDNIMGHHDISRGAQDKTQTATEAGILREADQTPVRLLVRSYEQSILKLYQWWMQLVALFYTEDHYIRIWGQQGVVDFQKINMNDVNDGINIVIRPGSTLPTDKKTLRQDAIQLAQLGLLDPLTLYETLEFPDPQKAVNRLVNWKQGIISDNPPKPTNGGGGQETPQVEWAMGEEERIAQGEMPTIRPDMVDEEHIGQHQMTLENPQYPQPQMLSEHMTSEIQLLQSQGGATPPQGGM